jgi:dipeptidase
MFHLMPDDTGASAVWVAQRVPDEHITAVANQFVIGQVNLDDKENFMASGMG